MTKHKGMDVSEHQGIIDWDKAKTDGVDFAMIRMGIGSDMKSQDDKQFERNVKEAERVGIPWGAYLYSYALNDKEVQSEVAHAKRLLKGKNPTYPVSFDMEDADGYKAKHGMPSDSKLVDFCYDWLKAMEDDGYYVSLYANKSWLEGKLKSSKLDRFDKWVAQWSEKCTYSGSYQMWQYTSKGKVNGVSGYVDLNYAYSDFKSKDNPKPKPKPKPTSKPSAYTVKKGDTLSEIAAAHGTTTKKLQNLNGIKNANLIHPGDKIKLTGSGKKTTSSKSSGGGKHGDLKITSNSGSAIVMAKPDRVNAKNIGTVSGKVPLNGSVRGKNSDTGYWEIEFEGGLGYVTGEYGKRV